MDSKVTRRDALMGIVASTAAAASGHSTPGAPRPDPVLAVSPLGMPWRTPDPFLMCVHHDDNYPSGDARMGPTESLAGRDLGQDFGGRDGWSMYHGQVVPGFPRHPHRGFETVTVVRRGLLDHADSLGAAARYGEGDVQWLTAGGGIQHAEMFPLLRRDARNPLELFQIWLNLPSANKMVAPHFTMLWDGSIPRHESLDADGHAVQVTVVAGQYGDRAPLAPPPHSWASQTDSDVAIWSIKLGPQARWRLPAAHAGSNRSLYFFRGSALHVEARRVPVGQRIELQADQSVLLHNGEAEAELLLLQGRPINEPVVQHGPFVMNTPQEVRQAYFDYQSTQFGGWPWEADDPVHGDKPERFARHADGRIDKPV